MLFISVVRRKSISYHAQHEISNIVLEILHDIFIEDWQTEPYYQHLNAAECCWLTIKPTANTIMDRTVAPPQQVHPLKNVYWH